MNPARIPDLVTSLFRIVLGLLFALHGASSLFGVFGGNRGSGEAIAVGTWPGWYAAVIQLAGGLLVLSGLATRVSALVCSGSMAYAYFTVHQPDGLLPMNNGGERAALFCWCFLLIAALGPGRWSVDHMLTRRRASVPEPAVAS
ncbi:DoxX family protein [Phytohabitans houttuyneae]|jgi:putative oxidoreductase|uniref:Integral membrane protein n=1 Tax=Phytohabitans houttuyneae TaxID=1076126 RepID=A0A6V8K4D1_9ACTN|nr:DoxX family protein [Phytohabitans houttuyneae]GFJ76637.1 integral membrane protein [Phytohabitans houttuyneae]